MKKNIISIVILLLAISIIVINLWEPMKTRGDKVNPKPNIEESILEGPLKKTNSSSLQEGDPAPDFELTTLTGKKTNLSDFKGKKIILNFWASWCPPCVAEMPHMQKFYEKNKDNGIEIVAVNLTSMEKKIQDVKDFSNKYELSFPILLDEKGEIGSKFQAFGIPTSYIVDSKGIIRKKIVGPMDEGMIKKLIDET